MTFTSAGLLVAATPMAATDRPQQADLSPDLAACRAANGHAFEVWEAQDESREQVLVRWADGAGDWLPVGRKYAYSESLLELLPGDAGRPLATLAADKAALTTPTAAEPDLEPADALHLTEILHTVFLKYTYNMTNAATETARTCPVVSSLKRATPAAAAAVPRHASMMVADWFGGPAEGPRRPA